MVDPFYVVCSRLSHSFEMEGDSSVVTAWGERLS